MEDKNLRFHIENNDYFGTQATIIDLILQDIEKKGITKSHIKCLLRMKKGLILLQSRYQIIKK